MGEFYVEWEFVETPFGMRPIWIRFFNTEEEADEFCKYKTDAKKGEMVKST